MAAVCESNFGIIRKDIFLGFLIIFDDAEMHMECVQKMRFYSTFMQIRFVAILIQGRGLKFVHRCVIHSEGQTSKIEF